MTTKRQQLELMVGKELADKWINMVKNGMQTEDEKETEKEAVVK